MALFDMIGLSLFNFIRHPLDSPRLYLGLQSLIGAKRARRICLNQYALPKSGERVLDVGCGPGFIVDYLPAVTYTGVDIDQTYIEYAQQKYGNIDGKKANFYCELLTADKIDKYGKFDLILLNGLLHHLSDPSASELLQLLSSALLPTGRLMTLDGCRSQRMSWATKFLFHSDRGQYIRDELAYVALAKNVFSQVDSHFRENLFFVPYDALVMLCRH